MLEKLEVSAIGHQSTLQIPCGLCGGPHDIHNCSMVQEVKFLLNKNHPNFSWGGNQGNQDQWNNNNFQNNHKPQQPPQRQPPYPQPSNNSTQTPLKQSDYLEDALAKLTINCNAFIDETRSNLKKQGEAIKKVEVQVGD
ncbi:hypothetical protein PIB30_090693 [Stylosanthes scabra]|uniref:Uncharacterized protein n=1 Tax=Stylosanthes scabra TaxID=79078 RepID=A0ABU6TTW5_9FABA|nr:hypothetical protein [Stylosanthes scabra]